MKSDTGLKDEVLAELAWDPKVDAAHITLNVRDALVTLTGHVASFWQKQAAEQAVARVKGVKAVTDLIKVVLPVQVSHSDQELATAVVNRLAWEGAVPPGEVQVTVEGGHVTLSGTVAQAFQRDAALRAVTPLWGVLSVIDEIQIAGPPPRPSDPNRIADDIRRALNRGLFAADTVHVSAQGGTVVLSGSAESLRDRDLAVATAWAAPGTMTVENHIRIS